MSEEGWRQHPHRRRNALTGEWVLVSPQRTQRPWQGEIERLRSEPPPRYDPACYLCPGNERANGVRNPTYDQTFVFENDFPALSREPPETHVVDPLLSFEPVPGACRVICFSPRHDLSISEMNVVPIRGVVDAWSAQYAELSARDDVNWVQIFENRGALMGASNAHPHGQIWAPASLPNEAVKESRAQREFLQAETACLLCRYVTLEIERDERLVYANDAFVVIVPFWAAWPFETLLVSRGHRVDLPALHDAERDALAEAMHALATRYDALFAAPFPYSMGFHQRPTDGHAHSEWHLHAHYYPPLLRATERKFMVGYELLAEPQRDITPEQAARRLREI
jgi:UDPglucose--hexose-1-phosphate uridylyltransferase